ncbi:similar to Saccharomyces cerevisiae YDR522C SPS2 Protein expressed during sporulation, redundant with Sps22p for organization of the beta-glucan layer of the spore wall [Maudiozyma barnettii]|uniref:Similar to Saccharomyces cerevisiae YDR522C SPS2 Protein expressed during sporulation, redundant with Sps22p for organization of the beta-glucan layer of the spore wall n=1 Tax=Maudiozyma barnettii TaxID=61262 RepID=A0A8H2VDI6_9SACH|nr:uncharacterized protein KABA2_02S17226 [Kazachstania barnettii]CAB4253342.1 similar to Saccharomyces cerevisiae YDR522C SPS2 Protein expressed during sporulation, redundant with Sps22p for organization of the beta-glucan layer of the spore wall [Kazachstania barnettii]CAD1780876.1 similar to Saccharomyces cerevisiae YDR522C SPS2 Protein expressed during sporulation, redundant with Sps22p for organization of the beta-glucan layer of the spore wall [Kazachstania barnettii]
MRVFYCLPLILHLTFAFLVNYRQLHGNSGQQQLLSQKDGLENLKVPFSVEKRRLYHTLNNTANDLLSNIEGKEVEHGDENEDNDEHTKDKDNYKEEENDDELENIITHYSPAQGPPICKNDAHLIETGDQLQVLQDNCKEIIGDLIISPTYDNSIVDLGNIQKIFGNLVIEHSSAIIKIKAESLVTITQNFILKSLTSLVDINAPILKSVNSIDWKILPILGTLSLDNSIMVNQHIIISDTSLANIDQFLRVKQIDIFNINNNRFLETIKSNIDTINVQLTIHANARDLELDMPKLQYAQNLTIRDTSLINLPNLERVQSSFQIIENLITSLDISNLQYVGGTLGIIENHQLTKANFNNVTEVQGGLMIAHNGKLDKINFFQNLKQIGGAIHFEGKFSETNFENLKLVKGSAFIKSSSPNLDCSQWIASSNGRSIIRGGKVKCSSARKSNFLNVDKEGLVLESTENDNDDFDDTTGNYGSIDNQNAKQNREHVAKGAKKTSLKKKFSNASNTLRTSTMCASLNVLVLVVLKIFGLF